MRSVMFPWNRMLGRPGSSIQMKCILRPKLNSPRASNDEVRTRQIPERIFIPMQGEHREPIEDLQHSFGWIDHERAPFELEDESGEEREGGQDVRGPRIGISTGGARGQ